MGTVLLLTKALQASAEVLPGLALLSHQVKILPAEGSALLEAPDHDLLMIDGRRELAQSRDLCRLIRTTGSDQPVLLIVTEGGLAVVAADWGMDDVILETAGPAEIDARIRVAIGKLAARHDQLRPGGAHHPVRRGGGRRDDVHRQARRPRARPHLQGVRAAEVPRPAPRPRLHPRPAAAGGLGLRLLRRHPHGRRARTPAARQARHRQRGADRHRAQRRLPVRAAAARPGRRTSPTSPSGSPAR